MLCTSGVATRLSPPIGLHGFASVQLAARACRVCLSWRWAWKLAGAMDRDVNVVPFSLINFSTITSCITPMKHETGACPNIQGKSLWATGRPLSIGTSNVLLPSCRRRPVSIGDSKGARWGSVCGLDSRGSSRRASCKLQWNREGVPTATLFIRSIMCKQIVCESCM